MRKLVLIAHNIRSTHNVGSFFRTADGLNIEMIHLTGYTPYPDMGNLDPRLPHVRLKLDNQINKTALGAHRVVPFKQSDDLSGLINTLREDGYRIVALEQDDKSTPLQEYDAPQKIALLLGEEVSGIDPDLLTLCDDIVEIPMFGSKESFNVSVAAAMTLYRFRFC